MFSLFGGKLSSVFTMIHQGISKVIGTIVEKVADVVDTVTEIASSIVQPLTETLTDLPLLGGVVGSANDFLTDTVSNISGTLHTAADQFIASNLAGGAQTLLDGATSLVGDTANGLRDLLADTTDALSPITDQLNQIPVIGNVLEAVTDTTGNLLGFVGETADYVSGIEPVPLLGDLLNNPVAAIGGVVEDLSGSLDNLLDDIAPVTDLVGNVPVVGQIVDKVVDGADLIPDALFVAGGYLQQAPSFSDAFGSLNLFG